MQISKPQPYLESGRIRLIPPDRILPNPDQPRRIFDPDALQELADSISRHGLLQPISVRKREGAYELVAGERRLRAAQMAGLAKIPCIVLSVDGAESGMLALVENLQRRDLDYLEEAEGISRLMRQYQLSQEQVSRQLGKSQSAVANKLRLLRHSPAVRAALRESCLSERHARALLRLPSEAERLDAIRVIARRELNAAKTDAYIDDLLSGSVRQKPGLRKLLLKDVRLFLNSVDHHLETMKNAGIPADCTRAETEDEIILTIRLPKRKEKQP